MPALRRIERRGLVSDGELAVDLADGGQEFVSIDGDLFALFEGQRVRVVIEVVDDDGQTDRTNGGAGPRSVSG